MASYPPGPPPPYGYPPPPQMPPHQYTQWGPLGPPPPGMPPQQPHQPMPPPGPGMQILPTPQLIFTGAQATSLLSTKNATISLLNPQTNAPTQPTHHVKSSKHSKPHLTVSRVDPRTGAPTHVVGSATYSSLRSSITLETPATGEIKLATNHWSATSAKEFSHPVLGPLTWKSNSLGGKYELRDQGGRVLACYRDDSFGLSRKTARIEVFVVGDDVAVDFVLCSAIAVVKGDEKEAKKAMDVLGDVM